MNTNLIPEVTQYALCVLSILGLLGSLFVIGDHFANRRLDKKLKQERELDDIVASLLKDVNENYIGKHNR